MHAFCYFGTILELYLESRNVIPYKICSIDIPSCMMGIRTVAYHNVTTVCWAAVCLLDAIPMVYCRTTIYNTAVRLYQSDCMMPGILQLYDYIQLAKMSSWITKKYKMLLFILYSLTVLVLSNSETHNPFYRYGNHFRTFISIHIKCVRLEWAGLISFSSQETSRSIRNKPSSI